ncbi:lethal giant larvae like, C-terminal-domain-containing protein [Aspergillus egyptiacus]|nr:lethal giant larvae like, C-terminal-domain-containing protein [Aspergillus egyptiacus]
MSPPLRAPPDVETEISKKLVSVVQKHFPGPIHITEVYPLSGHLHSLYLVRLSDETFLLLKCSPIPTTPLLRREQILLDTEARALALLNQNLVPCIPKLLHYDPLGDLLGRSLLIRHHIPGSTLEDMEDQLTISERGAIDRNLGLLAKQVSQHISDSFGSLGQVASGAGKTSWREAFLVLFEGILRDSEDVFINLPYGEIRHQVTRLSPALDDITLPRLVVIDLGQPSQVLVDPKSKQLCGISGFDTAVWGDVYMAKVFEKPSPAALDGVGPGFFAQSESGRTRQLLYSCYRSVHRIALQYYRKNRDTAAEIDERRQLMKTLTKMITAGIQKDFSGSLAPELFDIDDLARCGVNSQISALAYDPVQSLLAVGTSESHYGHGQIYVFGQGRVLVVFGLPRKASAKFLQFCADKLVSVDSKSEISVYSLETRRLLISHAPPSHASALLTDPSLDYAFIGLQNGDIIAYDLDREAMTPFRIPNLWAQRNARARLSPVISLSFSPRDIGKILIGYPDGAVVFSFKQNVAQHYFEYEVPPGALGGNCSVPARDLRRPRLTRALWHPNGIFILTVHDDNSLVFWDTKDGRKLLARSISTPNVDQPGVLPADPQATVGLNDPITDIAWCVKANGDDSGLLIAGGKAKDERHKNLVFLDLGPTPNYQTSSWAVITSYLEKPKSRAELPIPPGAEVASFCVIPRTSPYYAGAHDPIAVIALLTSGELITLSFPSGHPIPPTNMLPPSLALVHPFVNKITLTPVDRAAWLGLKERRSQGPKFILGGAEARKPLKRLERRNVITAAHADGTVRLWDLGHDDEIENSESIQVDLARAVGRMGNIDVTEISFGSSSGELSVGLRSGEVAIFRWGSNKKLGQEEPPGANNGPGELTSTMHRTDPGLKQGFLPLTLLNMQQGPVTALKHSPVGFVAAGFEGGSVAIIDLRGPAIIHTANLGELAKQNKRSSFLKSRGPNEAPLEIPTSIEFGILTLEGEDYSSICCFVGTNRGNLATFKILPSSSGTYMASFAGSVPLDDKVISIIPVNADDGSLALATGDAFAGLRNGSKVHGAVVGVTTTGCRIFKPANSKGAHRSWDDYFCDSASVVNIPGRGCSLVGLFGDGNARAFSIPGLREIGCSKISHKADMSRLSSCTVAPNGAVLVWTSPSEIGLFNVWGAGIELRPSEDQLFNPQLVIPPRPTITNLQWISGTQYISPADMDILIGGPNRPPSKRMLEQMRLEEQERRKAAREGQTPPARQDSNEEGYLAYMTRQVQERTEKLNFAGDNMDRLEETSSGWARDVNKYVQNQKKKAVMGFLGSKFGL